MKIQRITYIIIFALFLSFTANAQLKKGDKRYEYFNYSEAIPYYLKATKSDDKEVRFEATQKLANCYRFTNDVVNAGKWYTNVLKYENTDSINYFYLGQSLRSQALYNKAAAAFKTFIKYAPDSLDADKYLRYCTDIKDWLALPDMADIKNVSTINSKFSDFCPAFYHDGIVFTSDRRVDGIDNNIYGWTNFSYLNLYYSVPEYTGNYWDAMSGPKSMSKNFNQTYHDGPASFAENDSLVYVTKTVTKDAMREAGEPATYLLKIFYAEIADNGKLQYKPFFLNNKNYSVAHPTLSDDGQTIIFSSDMPGGFGGSDLYICTMEDGKWSEPVNMGEIINTSENEVFPHLDNDSMLYFSSDGRLGFGGLDIYRTNFRDSTCNEPDNLLQPMNSSYDDFGIILAENGKDGLFSSNRPGGAGSDDIYSFKDLRNKLLISGFVKEFGLNKPILDATVFVFEPSSNEVQILKTDDKGFFQTFVHRNQNYIVKAMKDGYIYDCMSQQTSSDKDIRCTYLQRDLLLTKLELNQVFIVKNIYYDLDKFNIKEEAKEPLMELVELMKYYPITAELSSYTDSRAPAQYNMNLSQKRAESAVDFIVSQGIDASRLIAKGYGESKLLNHCSDSVECTEEEHAVNRRTEFRIVSLESGINTEFDYNPGDYENGDVINANVLNANFFDNCSGNTGLEEKEEPEIVAVEELSTDTLATDSIVTIFRVQLESTAEPLNHIEYFSDIKDIMAEYGIVAVFDNGVYNYQIGYFRSEGEANAAKDILVERGYKECFVVTIRSVYKNNNTE